MPNAILGGYLKLLTNYRMPLIGFGTSMLLGDTCSHMVDLALHSGYRLIDTAISYENQPEVGVAMNDYLRRTELTRDQLFLTTKLQVQHGDDVIAIHHRMQQVLEELQMTYVDLALVHSPFCQVESESPPPPDHYNRSPPIYVGAWQGLEQCVREGLVRSIGLSNFSPSQMTRVMGTARQPIANLQAECHVYLQQHSLRDFCVRHNISFTAYSPLGAGGRPPRHRTAAATELLDDAELLDIAKELQVSPAQVALRYVRSMRSALVVKSSSEERLVQNINIRDVTLSDLHRERLMLCDKDFRYYRFADHARNPEYRLGKEAF